MATKQFSFDTKGEAKAFQEGVEYVNDSTIHVIGINPRNGRWLVTFEDEDEMRE